MKTQHISLACYLLAAALVTTVFTGCETRSISDSGYRSRIGPQGEARGLAYRGELSEFDVLGVERTEQVSEEQIIKALDSSSRVKLRKGSSILLIQSGAAQPDDPMHTALNKHFNVVPFGGQPNSTSGSSYAKTLRLAAAQAGCETVVCYWGTLETARKDLATKSVSWVPVVGWVLPDEKQHMRIRLRVAVIDVRSGNWAMFAPQSFDNRAASDLFSREASDQGQVEKLKRLAYAAAAADLVKIYAN